MRDGTKFNLLPGGILELPAAQMTETIQPDGQVQLNVSGPRNKVRRLIESQIERFGLTDDAFDEMITVETAKPADAMPIHFHIGGTEQFRSVAKTGLAMLTRIGFGSHIRTTAFERVRAFIGEGTPYPDRLLGSSPPLATLRPLNLGQFDHTVFVSASTHDNRVLVLVELFATFQYGVVLTTTWDGPEIAHVHVVDPLTGENHDEDIDNVWETLTHVPFPAIISDVKSSLVDLERRLRGRERELAIGKMVDEACEEMGISSETQALTTQQLETLGNVLPSRFANLLLRIPWTRERPWRDLRSVDADDNTEERKS